MPFWIVYPVWSKDGTAGGTTAGTADDTQGTACDAGAEPQSDAGETPAEEFALPGQQTWDINQSSEAAILVCNRWTEVLGACDDRRIKTFLSKARTEAEGQILSFYIPMVKLPISSLQTRLSLSI